MFRTLTRACLFAALASSMSVGCSSSRPIIKKNPPPDPLLSSKSPVHAKYGTALDTTPNADPTPPTVPAGAWLTTPAQTTVPTARLGEPKAFRLTAEKRESVGTSVCAEGTLERNADDEWLLRRDDGTQVVVEGHLRLDLFEPGNRIRVEGRLVDPATPRIQVDKLDLIRR